MKHVDLVIDVTGNPDVELALLEGSRSLFGHCWRSQREIYVAAH